jgi:hypothetical protein
MLKRSERERLQDCLLLIQSARNILIGIHEGMVPGISDIEKCFCDADRTITRLLNS